MVTLKCLKIAAQGALDVPRAPLSHSNKNTAVSSITHTYTRCVCRAGPSQNPETMNLSSMAFLLQFQALPGGPPCHVLAIPIPASYRSFLLSQDIITSLRAAGLAKLYPGEGQDRDSKRRGGKRPGRVGWQKRWFLIRSPVIPWEFWKLPTSVLSTYRKCNHLTVKNWFCL